MLDLTAAEKLELLANAALVTQRSCGTRFVRPCSQKAVLVVIAMHDGVPLSRAGIAARTGLSHRGVELVLAALIADGLVVKRGVLDRVNVYAVSYARLMELQTREPAFSIGKPRMKAEVTRKSQRQRVRRAWKRRAAIERAALRSCA